MSQSYPPSYQLENESGSGGVITFNPKPGVTITLQPGEKWETKDAKEYWVDIIPTRLIAIPVMLKQVGANYQQLKSIVEQTSGAPAVASGLPNANQGDENNSPAIAPPGQASSPTIVPTEIKIPQSDIAGPRSDPKSNKPHNGADPVDLFTGEYTIEETDLEIPQSVVGLHFTRTYRSGTPVYGPFGWSWDHNHNIYLRKFTNGDAAVWNGRMHEDIYTFLSGVDYKSPRGVFAKLSYNSGTDTFLLEGVDGITWTFKKQSGLSDIIDSYPLYQITDKFSNTLTYTYEAGIDGRIRVLNVKSTTDKRFLKFTYGGIGRAHV